MSRSRIGLPLLVFAQAACANANPDAATNFLVSIHTAKGSRCGTDDVVYINLRGSGPETGYQVADFSRQNDFEQGNVGNYEVHGRGSLRASQVCLKKKCRFSDDWCPSSVSVYNRDNMALIGQTTAFGKVQNCKENCQQLHPGPSPPPEPSGKPVIDALFMADIGHAEEYSTLLTATYPMSKDSVQGSFSLYNALYDFVVNQGHHPTAAIIMGDVGYVGGDDTGNHAMMKTFQRALAGAVTPNRIFPQIGNHDVHYLGCIFPSKKTTCYFGAATKNLPGGFVSKQSISYDTWVGNWKRSYPGLESVILPPRTGSAVPSIKSWEAPLRYNFQLNEESSVYFIAGLVAGASQRTWGPQQPESGMPNGDGKTGSDAECAFLVDSLAHGRSLGKTVFVYLTHNMERLSCSSTVSQIDVWLYGHDHAIAQSVPSYSVVTQESRSSPIKLLIGNGGFDEGQVDVVSFGNIREFVEGDRVKVHFAVYDTCISAENCPSGISPNQHCWTKCYTFANGYRNAKATPSKYGYGFVLDAPAKASTLRVGAAAPPPHDSLGPLQATSESDVVARVGPPTKLEDMTPMQGQVEAWALDVNFHMFGDEDIPIGCVVWDVASSVAKTTVRDASDVRLCQNACKSKPGCGVFSFTLSAAGGPLCRIQTELGTSSYHSARGTISGPSSCGSEALACTAMPDKRFPGATPEDSMHAWPMDYQPQLLQCWPRRPDATLYSCPEQTLLADVAKGWPGRCEDMLEQALPTGKDCKTACWEDPTCPAWTLTATGECFHGIGNNCYSGDTSKPAKGQRKMSGDYRVLRDLTGVQVLGLAQVFGSRDLAAILDADADPATVCRDVCLSYTLCQYWQLLKGTGCYIEVNTETQPLVSYPLTKQQIGDDGALVVAGQFIQRFCPSYFAMAPPQSNVSPVDRTAVLGLDVVLATGSSLADGGAGVEVVRRHLWTWLLVGPASVAGLAICAALLFASSRFVSARGRDLADQDPSQDEQLEELISLGEAKTDAQR